VRPRQESNISLYFSWLLVMLKEVNLTTEEKGIPISLVQQIYDEMFSRIEGQKEFNADVIKDLKQLAVEGNLKKTQKVVEVIKSTLGDDNETT
jgi:hypothetical protein